MKDEKFQEPLNIAREYIEHAIGTIKHDGHLGTIQTDWILPDLEKALAEIGTTGCPAGLTGRNGLTDENFNNVFELLEQNAELTRLAKENENLKFQLQPQDLPVVPECVAEWIDKNISVAHNAELMIHNILICAIDNKNRYLFPLEVEKFVLKNPITFLNAVITGKYEVEKPQDKITKEIK